ncbi:MAG TPA: outer membrane beta-barrel family protein, partial [Chryseosolibacter sp.]|nr:outer membrane beta-barrel family protein [Chryseosolibacter sp.]
AIPFANVAVFSTPDSSMVTGAVSDENGTFSTKVNSGQYYLRITFLSYQEKIVPVNVTDADVALGNITLASGTQVLESVTVEGERSQMELYLDKRVFEVGKDLSNISGSASDILDNVPSVTVDVDGNVSLRGSSNVRILIDGRPSGLTGISTADALQQLQGNLIERIEVITNPSARFDAEGEVGIINIILKKNQKRGVNGTVSLNTGYPHNHGGSFSLNWRRPTVNFFTSYGINYRKGPGRGNSFQRFTTEDTTFSYQQIVDRDRSDISHNIRGGMDLFLKNSQTLTASAIVRNSQSLDYTDNEYRDFDEMNTLQRTVIRNERQEEPELNTELALSYKKEYAKKGQQLTADVKWIENIETEMSQFRQTDLSIDSTGYQRSENTENERNLLFQTDYIHPFSEKGKFEAGIKSTQRIIDNDFTVEQLDQENNAWNILPELDNNLLYTENIHAGYFIIGNELNKFSWQAGVRGELTDISVELTETKEKSYQNYFNVFPSAHLSYRIAKEKTLQLSYSYRLSRPRFRELMPFSSYSDNRSVRVGNPNLRPEYTNSIEAGYLINWETGSVLSSAYYRYRTGVVERIALVDSLGFSRRFPVNLGSENAYGFEFNLSWTPVKIWRLNTNANFYRAITEGTFDEESFYADTYTWTSRTTSRITFFKAWDFQTGFTYRAPRETPQGTNKALYSIDLGLSRDVLKGNGTLTFAVRDLLNSRKFRSIVERPEEGYYSENEYQGRLRQFMLTFTYRINREPNKNDRERNKDDDDDAFDGGDD